jgi:hypothetical protein
VTDEYIPFEEALQELQMSEDELKRLVSEAEIQAVRNEGQISLRRADIDALRDRQDVAEELVFAEDDLEDDSDETGMVTAVLEEDSLLEEEETLDLDDDLEVDEEPSAPTRSRATAGGAAPVRSRGRAAALRADDEDEGHEKGFDKFVLILTTVLLIFAWLVASDITKGTTSDLTRWLAGMFVK